MIFSTSLSVKLNSLYERLYAACGITDVIKNTNTHTVTQSGMWQNFENNCILLQNLIAQFYGRIGITYLQEINLD